MNKNPKFIVFEGIDGAGKTTQINLLREALERMGFSCFVTAEPTDMPSGKAIRRALAKEVDSTPIQMAEMFAHDRELHNTDAQNGIEQLSGSLGSEAAALRRRYGRRNSRQN